MTISERIDNDIKEAMKSGQKDRLTVLRGLKSDIKYKLIDKGSPLSEEETVAVLMSNAKKVKDSIDQFRAGGRTDLVDKEEFGLKVIQDYLPEQMSEDKLRDIIQATITEIGADSAAKVGLVMKAVLPKVKGQADGKLVNRIALELLAK